MVAKVRAKVVRLSPLNNNEFRFALFRPNRAKANPGIKFRRFPFLSRTNRNPKPATRRVPTTNNPKSCDLKVARNWSFRQDPVLELPITPPSAAPVHDRSKAPMVRLVPTATVNRVPNCVGNRIVSSKGTSPT